ncbi:type VI immunity family protein [Myxococcus sp. RHSTA-1-4]|uniref:type VI immunity family protein n=1 Tax=Myxococcus sp. RHSTA-1-4 TaxID=2874601 RepID=UPI001CC07205|nr:type VI immunity family protein [Myxococcus sp. RHSTA-1-4]MBZ4422000.1 DUF3396 domain-containing protein [Myxococcus sp. RHSTA-1-4]
MHRSHQEFAPGVLCALDTYTKAAGPDALAWYPGLEGNWQKLDANAWERFRQDLLKHHSFFATLVDRPDDVGSLRFEYCGISKEEPGLLDDPRLASVATFVLPVEFLEQRGPGQVRELALQVASHLPFHSGYASLSFNLFAQSADVSRQLYKHCFRYPGMDMLESRASWDIGTRVPGAYWLTFLSNPVLGELGGAEGLRARLASPGTTVQQLADDRAVVTLGQWPEAGDLEAGKDLPAYRELAHVLEPWLYHCNPQDFVHYDFSSADRLRWERRFLD